jgi:hypothetical protein
VQPSQRLRRGVVAVLVAAALPLLSGCASGFDSPVLQHYNPTVGANIRNTEVYALNMLVVTDNHGSGTLVGSLLNKSAAPDTLVGATLRSEPGEPPVRSSMQTSSVTLTPEQLVDLSQPPTLAVRGDPTPGLFVALTLRFQRAEPIHLQVPVVEDTGPYSKVPIP